MQYSEARASRSVNLEREASQTVNLEREVRTALQWLHEVGVTTESTQGCLPNPEENFVHFMSQHGEQASKKLQHLIMITYMVHIKTQLEATETDEDRARRLSASEQHASRWLTTFPTQEQFYMSNTQVSIAVRNRLGLRPLQLLRTFNELSRIRGNHNYAISIRHNLIRDALASIAARAGALVEREPWVNRRKRADLLLRLTQQPQTEFFVDLMVVAPTTLHHLAAAQSQLGAAAAGEEAKTEAYRGIMQEDQQLMPFVVESFGGIGQQAKRVLQALAVCAQEMFNLNRDEFLAEGIAIISFAIQQGNAEMVLRQFRNSSRCEGRSSSISGN